MFGYILPDKANMLVKDYALYRAFYCGICKNTGRMYGQLARLLTNYDITFIAILLYNIKGYNIEIINRGCLLNPFRRKSSVKESELLKEIINLNLLLSDFKIKDDILDTKSIKKKIVYLLFRRKVNKAAQAMPKIKIILDKARDKQNIIEHNKTESIDRAADTFACMMRDIFNELLQEKFNDNISSMIYQLGRFIYVIDALQDYDKDIKDKSYNPFIYAYPNISNSTELFNKHNDDIEFILKSACNEISAHQFLKKDNTYGILNNIINCGLCRISDTSLQKERQ